MLSPTTEVVMSRTDGGPVRDITFCSAALINKHKVNVTTFTVTEPKHNKPSPQTHQHGVNFNWTITKRNLNATKNREILTKSWWRLFKKSGHDRGCLMDTSKLRRVWLKMAERNSWECFFFFLQSLRTVLQPDAIKRWCVHNSGIFGIPLEKKRRYLGRTANLDSAN